MDSPVNLFTLAAANGPALEDRFDRLLTSSSETDAQLLSDFARIVEAEGRVTVNLPLEDCLEFLKTGRQLNIHEWAEEEARRTGHPADQFVLERLRRWYPRRVGFEDRFDGGHRFHYGALSIGGIGPKRYGNCCAVASDRFLEQRDRLAFLERDSLRHFVDDQGAVRMEDLETSLAEAGHHLLRIRHHRGTGTRPIPSDGVS